MSRSRWRLNDRNVPDAVNSGCSANRAIVQQKKTGRPLQFEIIAPTREAAEAWMHEAHLHDDHFPFLSRIHNSPHICTRQYARMLRGWLKDIGLDWRGYGTHSMRRTKATPIDRKTKNLRAVQLLLGHVKLDYLAHRTMSRTCSMP